MKLAADFMYQIGTTNSVGDCHLTLCIEFCNGSQLKNPDTSGAIFNVYNCFTMFQ